LCVSERKKKQAETKKKNGRGQKGVLPFIRGKDGERREKRGEAQKRNQHRPGFRRKNGKLARLSAEA